MRKIMTEREESESLAVDAVGLSPSEDYSRLGAHVASVLEAAKLAGERVKDEARHEAAALGDASQREAAQLIGDANREAEAVLLEAQRARAAADEAATAVLQDADAYAEQTRREAAEQAASRLQAAEQEASERAQAAQERDRSLQKNLAMTEQRLKQLTTGLRELASRLEELVDAGDTKETLEESLKPSVEGRRAAQESTDVAS